jgi:hypothetical protein
MSDANDPKSMERRKFLRKAGVVGAAIWAAPVIQTVAATPAYAQQQGSPGGCFHSIDLDEGKTRGCMETCKGACEGKQDFEGHNCSGGGGFCASSVCNPNCDQGNQNACADQFCNPECYECDTFVSKCQVGFVCSV